MISRTTKQIGKKGQLVDHLSKRLMTTSTTDDGKKGDISSVFPSLVGQKVGPLNPEFKKVQQQILKGNEEQIRASWDRLLPELAKEVKHIQQHGNKVIPQIDFSDMPKDPSTGEIKFPDAVRDEVAKRGLVIIRNVIPRDQARQLKFDTEEYIRKNETAVRGFPEDNPTVFELYWSKAQLFGRTHPNSLALQQALGTLWHSTDKQPQLISTRHPVSYADRLRIRLPGDSKFMLGPHIDGGSVERWEDPEYSTVYKSILTGQWEKYDPLDYRHRLDARSDLHNGMGQCSMFRMFQGWLSMSETGPNEGTLMANPMLKHATAYVMLRPFFAPKSALRKDNDGSLSYDPNNGDLSVPWEFTGATSCFPNSMPGCGQELNHDTHPHLHLDTTMVPMPKMYPGDYVAWHTDSIHAVESKHMGEGDSSVLYVPATPLTESNLQYLERQRAAFLKGSPAPDFPDAEHGSGEHGFVDVGTEADLQGKRGRQAFGIEKFDVADSKSESEKLMLERANSVLFPSE